MNEMDRYFDDMLDRIYDEENNEVILLRNENGEDIAFEQIALVPMQEKVYIILKPVQPIDGLGEDEGLVFLVNEGLKRLELVIDEEIIDQVFTVYDRLTEEEEC